MARYRKWKKETREKKLKELEAKGVKTYAQRREEEMEEKEKAERQARLKTLANGMEMDEETKAITDGTTDTTNDGGDGDGDGEDDDVPRVEDVTDQELGLQQDKNKTEDQGTLAHGGNPAIAARILASAAVSPLSMAILSAFSYSALVSGRFALVGVEGATGAPVASLSFCAKSLRTRSSCCCASRHVNAFG